MTGKILPPGLYCIATPIGNLGDATERMRQVIEGCEVLLCEDTRRTRELLSALGLTAARLERFDQHLEARTDSPSVRGWIALLEKGATIGLVSDAGTPGVSDPGAVIVRAAHVAGIPVHPVAGASSVAAFVSAAGFAGSSFVFRGFFPRAAKDTTRELDHAASGAPIAQSWIWFESPHRVVESLAAVAARFPDLRVIAAKELTKFHERFFSGSAREVAAAVAAEIAAEGEKGEWIFGLEMAEASAVSEDGAAKSSDWVNILKAFLDAGVSAPEAAKRVSQVFGVSRKLVYDQAVALSSSRVSRGRRH